MAKETMDKMKRQPTEWERISANDMAEKRSIYIYISYNSILRKTNNLLKK